MSNNSVVKIFKNDDGEKEVNPVWHLIDPDMKQGKRTLCSNEFFGIGESQCVFKQKIGKITCHRCIELIKLYQQVKL